MAAKGYDDSPPRNGTIFFYTVLAVVFLVGVKFLLDSYFFKMVDAEVEDKILTQGMDEVRAMRDQEQKSLEGGAMPIENAMKMLSQRGRAGMPEIAPQSGMGKPAVAGWSQLKREAAPAPAAAPAAPAAEGSQPAPGAEPAAPAAPAPAAPAHGALRVRPEAGGAAEPAPAQPAAPDGKR